MSDRDFRARTETIDALVIEGVPRHPAAVLTSPPNAARDTSTVAGPAPRNVVARGDPMTGRPSTRRERMRTLYWLLVGKYDGAREGACAWVIG